LSGEVVFSSGQQAAIRAQRAQLDEDPLWCRLGQVQDDARAPQGYRFLLIWLVRARAQQGDFQAGCVRREVS
jgi:hypothetical protein